MFTLYPAIKPRQRHSLKVDPPHELYVEESGSPHGIPVLFVHGGPGMACDKHSRRFFDPEVYRIILFDQRGTGRSTPHAELEGNDTEAMVADIERVREFMGIDKWVLFGGAWGATLSLLYAQRHPDRVLGMVLRGTILCRDKDIRWIFQEGASRVFPDYWQEFCGHVPEEEREDLLGAYYRRLVGPDDLARMGAARAWAQWEGRCASLRPNQNLLDTYADPHRAKSMARMQSHYFINRGFIDENQILDNMDLIADIPSILVHGRYDMISPLDNAFELQNRWPMADLHIVRDAGHSSMEPSISDALIRATDEMARRLRPELGPSEG
ncbi:prolyl aminopeptidase [Aestuariirhabdus litorea]|uniref:Proline iminopeptidase n=1 Tax=Aestuariirhabdus litorea TaxID=2528527 RepID=A0A3P3VK97_9GAMM|nr:prolyl aminopeptidase [Aestuariirhabdus litorea]RRJ83130.1 prolyl aminopeptidase [Aestuariirhabdus litorea]RWW93286.1 prolyl aminopeptidase [Endozoicomonadaceae bacterium GTF-13]